MRAFVLGGTGKVGRLAAELLAAGDVVSEVSVAGRNIERAQELADELGDVTTAVQVDGSVEDALTAVLEGHDILINAAWGATIAPAIRACARIGAHYCDVVTWATAVDEVLTLAPLAQEAGITAMVALGISPSTSNLMGVHAARQLDEVEQLQLGRCGIVDFRTGEELTPKSWAEDPTGSLCALKRMTNWLKMTLEGLEKGETRTVLEYGGGAWQDASPMRKSVRVPLTDGRSARRFAFASTSPSWGEIAKGPSAVEPAVVYHTVFPPPLDALLREQAIRVLDEGITAQEALDAFYAAAESDPEGMVAGADGGATPGACAAPAKMWVRAVGRKDGRAASYTCWFNRHMWDVLGYPHTSMSLVAGANMILRGEVDTPGVMTAEAACEPLAYFLELVKVMPEPPPDGRMLGETWEWPDEAHE